MFNEVFELQKEFFRSEKTKTYKFRIDNLNKLYNSILQSEDRIIRSLFLDLGKSEFEAYLTEIGVVKKEIKDMLKHLKSYIKPRRVKQGLALLKAKSYIYQEPFGTVLIISPWNYPFQLALAPLIGAIAAGNTAIVKVSEHAPHTASIIKELIENNFDPAHVSVITGGISESQALLKLPFDYIFFTGSPKVGKIVMKEASRNLTPVTLELGGKSPAIIEDSRDISLISKRIAYGKFLNAGQTCIAPDYIWVKEGLKNDLVKELKKSIHTFYGDYPISHENYPMIINLENYERLCQLIDQKKVIHGGRFAGQKIEPTLIHQITWDDKIMNDEIFGPILPIMTYQNIEDVINELKTKDKPLALYLFTENKDIKRKIIQELSFGGATINDTLMHFANENIPFGGVGNSGMGAYHGRHSFATFSHPKGVIDRSVMVDISLRYFPVTEKKKFLLKKFLK